MPVTARDEGSDFSDWLVLEAREQRSQGCGATLLLRRCLCRGGVWVHVSNCGIDVLIRVIIVDTRGEIEHTERAAVDEIDLRVLVCQLDRQRMTARANKQCLTRGERF